MPDYVLTMDMCVRRPTAEVGTIWVAYSRLPRFEPERFLVTNPEVITDTRTQGVPAEDKIFGDFKLAAVLGF